MCDGVVARHHVLSFVAMFSCIDCCRRPGACDNSGDMVDEKDKLSTYLSAADKSSFGSAIGRARG